MSAILPSIVDEGRRLLDVAHGEGATLALLGGVAIRLHAADIPASLDRQYKDLDFAVPKGRGRDASKVLGDSGYEPEVSFNAMNGNERLLFHDLQNGRQVDVFVGSFRMCHVIPLTERLSAGQPTVPLAELLLTKLQIIELNEKDVRDTMLLFYGHEVADHDDDAVNGARIAERFGAVLDRIEAEPKSRGWKLRARIGERKRWYELPEEVRE